MLKGSIVALITPFKDDNLDENTYRSLIDYHLNNGTNGVVPGGTTGESPTLSHSEHKKIIEIAVKECNGKIPVIAGTGSNSTDEAVELSQFAEKAGSDALLVVTPYYNKHMSLKHKIRKVYSLNKLSFHLDKQIEKLSFTKLVPQNYTEVYTKKNKMNKIFKK